MRSIAQLAAACAVAHALAAPGSALAEPTGTCHCFRDRTFDAADPSAADPYILATTRSSLLSAAFGVPKASLVRAVMSGAAADDLWVAYWSGARIDRAPASLLDAVEETRSWRAVLAGAKSLPEPFAAALARNASAGELAALAVDDVLAARLGAEPGGIRALRSAGATSEQVIVATFLAGRLHQPAAEVLSRFRSGKASWGALLRDAGLAPDGIDGAMRASLR